MRLNKSEYEQKKKCEKAWYTNQVKNKSIAAKILHTRLFYHPQRNAFNYVFPKEQMAMLISQMQKKKSKRMLIAPCGAGDDFKYLKRLAEEIYGIDLSEEAVKKCPARMKAKSGDILKSGYRKEMFDIIVSPLFFHHLLNVGFDPFLKEFNRILKPGGLLVILEPSLLYPLNIITRPIKMIFNNPYGEVEDESPFSPHLLTRALRNNGFNCVNVRAATFSHCSFYVPFAKFYNLLTKPLLGITPFKYIGWMILYSAKKKSIKP